MSDSPEAKLLTVSEVSKRLGINRNATYELIKHNHLQALKLGSLKVSTIELENFMQRNINKDFTDLKNVKELPYRGGACLTNTHH